MKAVYKHWYLVSAYSVTHFIIDFACAFLMFRSIAGTPDGYLCVLIYNFCAFAMQMPLGIIADKWNKNYIFAIIGCAFVGAAYSLILIPVLAVTVVGIGNAMFHVGGGIDVLNISVRKAAPLGVFVSPGAFGVFYGTMLGRDDRFSAVFILLALTLSVILIWAAHKIQAGTYPKNVPFSLNGIASMRVFIAVVCLFLVVCVRSYVGLAMNFSWKGIDWWGTTLVCAVVFGKTLGGFAADKFRLVKASIFSLGLAAVLFVFSGNAISGVTAVLLFNMTMPVTLWVTAKVFPGAKGFSFGLLTFALFLGFLPKYLGLDLPTDMGWLYMTGSVLSLALLLIAIQRVEQ